MKLRASKGPARAAATTSSLESLPFPRRKKSTAEVGTALGFRSGLEEKIAAQLRLAGIVVQYESVTIPFSQPEKPRKYTPDFPLPNGIIVETKGRFVTADRHKHLLVQAQHPDLDIRFVFSNSRSRISKQSKTTYALWCKTNGFQFADKSIPAAWLTEPPHLGSLAALATLMEAPKKK